MSIYLLYTGFEHFSDQYRDYNSQTIKAVDMKFLEIVEEDGINWLQKIKHDYFSTFSQQGRFTENSRKGKNAKVWSEHNFW